MTDDAIISAMRELSRTSSASMIGSFLETSRSARLTQSVIVFYFKRAFPQIPLRVLIDVGAVDAPRVGVGDAAAFDAALAQWLPMRGER